jgi:vacuolar-type H+-ATPase subunit E/Vma4
MSDQEKSQDAMIERILATARSEAETVLKDAEKSIADRQKALENRIATIRTESERKTDEQIRRIAAHADAVIAMERSRSRLRQEGHAYRMVEERVAESICNMRDRPTYTDVIRDWIVEAACGVDADEMIVTSPEADRKTVETVIDEAARRVSAIRDSKVTLRYDNSTSISGQGVVVRDSSGRTAFSNLVRDRIRRNGPALRTLVYRTAIEEHNDG